MVKKIKSTQKFRLIIQTFVTAFSNGFVKGFYEHKIFEGKSKYICVPGLNCYSCPSAFGSCPIGSLQAVLSSREYNFSFYVIGLLVIFGSLLGRFICGFLCPFGLVQDLLYKIPFFKKIKILKGEKFLRVLKFFILLIFVILLPLFFVDITGLGMPWFCKYICPQGTLEAGIPLVLLNPALRSSIGFLFKWKTLILIITIIVSIIIYRPFCRYICPLGAIYGLFNKFSLVKYSVDIDECTKCGKCKKECKFNIDVFNNPNSIDCIRCGLCKDICPENAIKIKFF